MNWTRKENVEVTSCYGNIYAIWTNENADTLVFKGNVFESKITAFLTLDNVKTEHNGTLEELENNFNVKYLC